MNIHAWMYYRVRRQILRMGAIRSVWTTNAQRQESPRAHLITPTGAPCWRPPYLPHEWRLVRRDRGRRLVVALLVAFSMTVIDQGSKALALTRLSEHERIPLVGDLLGLQLAFNPGTVMSLGSGSTWVFTVIGTTATIALLYVRGDPSRSRGRSLSDSSGAEQWATSSIDSLPRRDSASVT